jgi:putative phosphoribosyl transferase
MPNDSNPNHYFTDREDAANQLIETLPLDLLDRDKTITIAVSEGGVYFANRISRSLKSPMDILLTEAILAPHNREVVIAMVSETEEVVMHKALVDAFGINEDYIYSEAERKYEEEILSYLYKYRRGKEILSLEGKYVLLVDECVETGLTMMIALKSVIERGAKNIYIATPVLDRSVYENLLGICDGVFCPQKIENYISIEYYYERFQHSTFDEIITTIHDNEINYKKE